MERVDILGFDKSMFLLSGLHILTVLLYLIIVGLSIYCLILFVKVARRGIIALDFYINKNKE